jgi:hypothetical protein
MSSKNVAASQGLVLWDQLKNMIGGKEDDRNIQLLILNGLEYIIGGT